MKIAILSCFYPYRGGIAQFNAALYKQLQKNNKVRAYNFTRQYPDLLFPGQTQFVTKDDEAVPIESIFLLDTVNPFTWIKTVKAIEKWKPQIILIDYWMSWFAPSLGFVARRLKSKFTLISILHNVIPHEPHVWDKPLTKYFLSGFHGHVVLSEEVKKDLLKLNPKAKYTELFHPIYTHFGAKQDKTEAEKKLGISNGKKNILFFGMIRDYKGLDILIKAFDGLDDSYQLIIAGEPYGSFEKYSKLIDTSRGKDRIYTFLKYIKDSEVSDFFSVADVTVLPYKSATQSGINAVSCHFEVPMIVTGVGSLKENVGDVGTGLVAASVTPEAIREEITKYFGDDKIKQQCYVCIRGEKERLSWFNFAKKIEDFAKTI